MAPKNTFKFVHFCVAFILEVELPFQMYSLVLKRTRFQPGSFFGSEIVSFRSWILVI